MNFAQHFILKGRQEGIQEGRRENLQKARQKIGSDILLELLREKFKTLPTAYLKKIKQADPEMILVWTKRILSAPSLEEVFKR